MKKTAKASPETNDLHGFFDEMVDAVLVEKKENAEPVKSNLIVRNKASVESWSIPLQQIYSNETSRLDASHYDQETAEALRELTESGFELDRLSDLADVRLPGQFVRIWAEDAQYGLTYVNASDLLSLCGIGSLSGETRYLSRETETNLDELIIREGWLLVSCSGTIGRIFYSSARFDGWAATHDLIRIIPKPGVPVGFLHAYLSSPVAQKQILGHTHGGQIDHITHHQIGGVLVPRIDDKETQKIHERTLRAISLREQALKELKSVSDEVVISLKSKKAKKQL